MNLPDTDKLLEDRKYEYAALAALIIAAMLYRCWGLLKVAAAGIPDISHVSYDGVYYVQTARNILAGDGLGWEATMFPVLQPILIAALAFVTGIKNLAFLSSTVSELSGLLLLVWVYFFAREMYGKKAAFAAVLLLIPYPHLVAIAGADTVESLYASLVCLSVLAGYKALKSGRAVNFFLAGVCIGVAYLARPEGFIFFACFLALTAWVVSSRDRFKNAVKPVALVTVGFLIFALPYIVFLTKSYGRLVISSKLPYESVVMKAKVFQIPVPMTDIEGITENGRLAWQEYGGAGRVLEIFREDPGRFMRAYMDDLESELPWNVGNSSQLAGYPVVYPLYFWIPAILGMLLLLRRKETLWTGLLIACPFMNMFVYAVFSKGFWIYHAPYVPLLVVLAVGGAVFVREKLPAGIKWVPALTLFVFVWMGYSAYVMLSSRPESVDAIAVKTLISDESLKAGRWSRENIGTRTSCMMAWSRLVYYIGGRWVPLPTAPPEDAVRYGRNNGADYLIEELVGDDIMAGSRFSSVPSLEMAYCFTSNTVQYEVIFWRIMPEYGG